MSAKEEDYGDEEDQTELALISTEGSKVQRMQEGDYVVHVHIQVGKDFSLQNEDVCDPQLYISCGEQLGKTSVKKDIDSDSQVKFDEHVFLELPSQTTESLKELSVKIEAKNNGFFKNDEIGSFEIPLTKIYTQKDHTMLNQYVSLSKIEDDPGDLQINVEELDKGTSVTATIAVSINVTGPGDEALELKLGSEEQLNEKPPLLPTAIEKTYKQATIHLMEAEDLPNMDTTILDVINLFENKDDKKNETDAYAIIKYGRISMRTEIVNAVKKDKIEYHYDPVQGQKEVKTQKFIFTWAERFKIPIQYPVAYEYFVIEVWDHNDFTPDKMIASIKIHVDDIFNQDKPEIKWLNLYAGPKDAKNTAVANWMTQNPEKASSWAGRILIKIGAEDSKHPIVSQNRMSPEYFEKVMNERNSIVKRQEIYNTFKAEIQIPSAIALPGHKKYKIRIKIGIVEFWSNDPIQIENEYARWNYVEHVTLKNTAKSLDELPDMFIQLIDPDTENPICFFRKNLAEFNTEESPLDPGHPKDTITQWIPFEADQSYGEVTDLHRAGFFALRMYAWKDKNDKFSVLDYPNWKKKMPRRNEAHKLRVAIYQCMNLPAADDEGTSDPYVKAWTPHGDQKNSTAVVWDDNNPIYYEVLEFNVEFSSANGLLEAPPIMLEVYDKDNDIMDSKDDFLGRAMVFLNDLPQEPDPEDKNATYLCREDAIVTPQLYPVKYNINDPWEVENGAAILCSFTLLPFDTKPLVPIEKLFLDIPVQLQFENKPQELFKMPDLDFKEFNVEIVALGLRELRPEGILPINKPYVKFKVKSLVRADQSRAIHDISTEPKDTGPNANLNSTLQFFVKLPSDQLFCPRMTCEVYDHIYFSGFSQPQIGSFTLKVGDERLALMLRDKKQISFLKSMIKVLEQVKDELLKGRQNNEDVNEWERVNDICTRLSKHHKGQKDVFDEDYSREHSKSVNFSAYVRKTHKVAKRNVRVTRKAKKGFKRMATSQIGGGNPFKNKPQDSESSPENSESSESMIGVNDIDMFQKKDVDAGKGDFMQFGGESQKLVKKEKRISKDGEIKKKFKKITRKVREAQEIKRIKEEKDAVNLKRDLAQEALADKRDSHLNVIQPKYIFDPRISVDVTKDNPPEELFMPVGYDKTRRNVRTFRRYFPDELEKWKDEHGHKIIDSPFFSENIYRATAKKNKPGGIETFFTGLFGGQIEADQLEDEYVMKVVGRFKGIIAVYNKEMKEEREKEKYAALYEIQRAIEEIYNLEMNHRMWQLEKRNYPSEIWDKLKPENGASFEKTKEVLRDIAKLLSDAGLGSLKLEEAIAKVYAEKLLDYYLKKNIKCRARVYILTGFNLSQRDMFSASDPYLIVRAGDREFSKRDEYQLDTQNPDFYQTFEFLNEYPGAPILEIEVWDYDEFFGDDLIGKTTVDLDDRYFSLGWQSVEDKPIEYRDLYVQTSNMSQGQLKMWVEIDEQESKTFNKAMVDIEPVPKYDVEVRCVIWGTRDLEEMDYEGCTDAYFRAYIDSEHDQQTDIHWRCQTGEANFNWRTVFTTNQKEKDLRLTIQGWDKDILTTDELIGSFSLPIDRLVQDCYKTERKFILSKGEWFENEKPEWSYLHWLETVGKPGEQATQEQKDEYQRLQDIYKNIEYDADEMQPTEKELQDKKKKGSSAESQGQKFWVPLYRSVEKDGVTEQKHGGDVLITVHVLPKIEAEKNPLGLGRDDLNIDPFCPPPKGRIEFSLNPFDMLAQLIPAKFRREICCYCCIILCVALLIYMLPMVISNGISKAIWG